MIWQALLTGLLEVVGAVLEPLLALVPDPPSWVEGSGFQDVVNDMAGVDRWLPISYALEVSAAVVSAYLTAGLVGVTRSMLSHVTGGGGAS